jgi:hypothetical protein
MVCVDSVLPCSGEHLTIATQPLASGLNYQKEVIF